MPGFLSEQCSLSIIGCLGNYNLVIGNLRGNWADDSIFLPLTSHYSLSSKDNIPNSESSFYSGSSIHFSAQTKRVRELKFWENVHSPPRVLCHVSHVMCQLSNVMCQVSHVMRHMSGVMSHSSSFLQIGRATPDSAQAWWIYTFSYKWSCHACHYRPGMFHLLENIYVQFRVKSFCNFWLKSFMNLSNPYLL